MNYKFLVIIMVFINTLFMKRIKIINTNLVGRGVHQIAQTTKTEPKPSAKWHNRIAPQVTVHRTA